jgi:DNA-binding transcriptional regulator LsrR (DeoR family)
MAAGTWQIAMDIVAWLKTRFQQRVETFVTVSHEDLRYLREHSAWQDAAHYALTSHVRDGEVGRLGTTRYVASAAIDNYRELRHNNHQCVTLMGKPGYRYSIGLTRAKCRVCGQDTAQHSRPWFKG